MGGGISCLRGYKLLVNKVLGPMESSPEGGGGMAVWDSEIPCHLPSTLPEPPREGQQAGLIKSRCAQMLRRQAAPRPAWCPARPPTGGDLLKDQGTFGTEYWPQGSYDAMDAHDPLGTPISFHTWGTTCQHRARGEIGTRAKSCTTWLRLPGPARDIAVPPDLRAGPTGSTPTPRMTSTAGGVDQVLSRAHTQCFQSSPPPPPRIPAFLGRGGAHLPGDGALGRASLGRRFFRGKNPILPPAGPLRGRLALAKEPAARRGLLGLVDDALSLMQGRECGAGGAGGGVL